MVRVSGEKKRWRRVGEREFRKVCWRVWRGLLLEEEGGVGLALGDDVLSLCVSLLANGEVLGLAVVDVEAAGCFSFLGGSLLWFAFGWLPDFLFLDFPMVVVRVFQLNDFVNGVQKLLYFCTIIWYYHVVGLYINKKTRDVASLDGKDTARLLIKNKMACLYVPPRTSIVTLWYHNAKQYRSVS